MYQRCWGQYRDDPHKIYSKCTRGLHSSVLGVVVALLRMIVQHLWQVVSSTLSETAQRMASQRSPNHKHNYITYPFDFGVFADDMAKIAKSHPIFAMHYGYKVLTAMTEMVIGNTQLLHQLAQLKPDLIIGDASASYGHWLTAKLGIPSIEFDVGTSSGLLHAGGFGGQLNPAYIPASGEMSNAQSSSHAQMGPCCSSRQSHCSLQLVCQRVCHRFCSVAMFSKQVVDAAAAATGTHMACSQPVKVLCGLSRYRLGV